MPLNYEPTGLHVSGTAIPIEMDWGIHLIVTILGFGVLIVGLGISQIIWDHFRYKRFASAVDALSGDDLGMSAHELESLKVQMYIADQNGDGLSFKRRLENATEYVLELRAERDAFTRADQAMRKQLKTSLDSGRDLFDWEKKAIKKYEDEAAFNRPIEQAIDRMKALAENKREEEKYRAAKSEVYRLLREKLQAEKYVLSNEQRNVLAVIEAERAEVFAASIKGKTSKQIDHEVDRFLKHDDERYLGQNKENRRRFVTKSTQPRRKKRANVKQRAGWFG